VSAAQAEKYGEEKPETKQPMDLSLFHGSLRTSLLPLPFCVYKPIIIIYKNPSEKLKKKCLIRANRQQKRRLPGNPCWNSDCRLRPEPRRVQGSHAPNVVHGGLKKKIGIACIHIQQTREGKTWKE
jgi:hypothetical protein